MRPETNSKHRDKYLRTWTSRSCSLVRRLKNLVVAAAAVSLFCASPAFGGPSPTPPDEAALEHNFDALIHPEELRAWMKLLAAEPNHVSSPHDKANADQILVWFKAGDGTHTSKRSR